MADVQAPLIETRALKKYFPVGDHSQLHAVDGINLKIYPGETLGVVGESGCGKSTLGRTILRLQEPTDGQILYDGKDITKYNRRQMKQMRQNMQLIFQDPYASLDPRKSVVEIIAEYMIINRTYPSKKEIYNYAAHLMDIVGLARRYANAYPHELDGGRRQRIGIARALSLHPKFIVCDEPVSALDVSIQAQVVNMFEELQNEMGLTYLFIAHDLAMVRHISDRVAVMYLGTVAELTSSESLYKNPLHPYTKALLSAIPIPDPKVEEEKERIRLTGEIPSPIDPPPGCRFAGRCRFAADRCRRERPELLEVEEGHLVACHLYEKSGKKSGQ